jgi:hypothetical protein
MLIVLFPQLSKKVVDIAEVMGSNPPPGPFLLIWENTALK